MASNIVAAVYRRDTNFNDIHANFTSDDAYKFAHGLTGTDQEGNALCTTILGSIFLTIAVLTFVFRLAEGFHRNVRERIIAEHGKSQKFWEQGHFPWARQVMQHSKDRPLRPGHSRDIALTKKFSLGLVPTRNQFIFTIFYVGINIGFTLWIPWKSNRAQDVAALRGRSGHLATFNLIFTTLFAFRNNPLILACQISFDSFNFYHRLFARITIVESILHIIFWADNTLQAGGRHGLHLALESSMSYRWGMVSFVAFTIILIQAWSPIRRFWYNLFIVSHRILATLAIVGLWLHIYYHKLPQMVWISITFGLLCGELLYRIVRIIYLNFHTRSFAGTKVEVRAFEGACRVTFHLNRPWRPSPGTHAHIYIPSVSVATSHPFSIAWSTDGVAPNSGKIESQPSAQSNSEANGESNADTELLLAADPLHEPKSSSPATISFIIRAREGFTQQLHRLASKSPSGVHTTWGFVEGAYGSGHSMSSYGTVVLFAGGVGITHVIPYLRDCVVRANNGTGACQKVRLVWSVPNAETVEWIRDWLEEVWVMDGAREMVRVTVFVSRRKKPTADANGDAQDPEKAAPSPIPEWVETKSGRCDPNLIMEEEVRDRVGAMAVMVCGPGGVGEGVRLAVRKRMTECSVDLFEESFTY